MRRSIHVCATMAIWLWTAAAPAQDLPEAPMPPASDEITPCSCCQEECCCEPGCITCCECACCEEICCPTVQMVTEEKACWDVKCKKVCVPAVRFPWEEGGCRHNRILDCLCRLCCGSCSYAAYGGPRAAANCCDGCSPPLVLPDDCGGCCSSCGCGVCDDCCSCCQTKCGYVRCVNVLEERTYDITKCECKWEVRRLPCCGNCVSCAADCADCCDSEVYFDSAEAPWPDGAESDE